MFDFTKELISQAVSMGAIYAEGRVVDQSQQAVTSKNNVSNISESETCGFGIRVLIDGHWGFASNPNISDDAVESVIRSSTDNVRFLNKRDTSRCGIMLPETFINFEKSLPLKRYGNHQELANLAAYLLSDYAGYFNGEVVTIDGGEWLKGAGQFNELDRLPKTAWKIMEKLRKKSKKK